MLSLLFVWSSPITADSPRIEKFHDEEHALVTAPDGSLVPLSKLGSKPPFDITGMEGGQYLFMGPNEEEYRVYVPEVVTNQSKKRVIVCDQSQAVFADDYRIASARGVDEECE
ncbi:MAG: hypothetical protein HLUCCO03_02375 [Marinobacter sp. HL-58]|nr:MAG: hypothetical protein HLUCCO03_02375 [Marinobacter sp. HL-58]